MRPIITGETLFAAVICLLFIAQTASAQVHTVSLEELSKSSTSIVVGTTQEMRSFWNDSRSQILTEVTIRVSESVKGQAPTETVVTVPGGQVGNTLYEVSDMPVFVDEEEVLVFLWEHPTGRNLVNGGPQGKIEIVADRVTGQKRLRGLPRAVDAGGLSKAGSLFSTASASGDVPLENALTRIKAFLGDE